MVHHRRGLHRLLKDDELLAAVEPDWTAAGAVSQAGVDAQVRGKADEGPEHDEPRSRGALTCAAAFNQPEPSRSSRAGNRHHVPERRVPAEAAHDPSGRCSVCVLPMLVPRSRYPTPPVRVVPQHGVGLLPSDSDTHDHLPPRSGPALRVGPDSASTRHPPEGSRGRDGSELAWESRFLLVALLEVLLQLPMDGSHHLPRLFLRPEVNPEMSRTTAPAFLEPEQRSRTQRTLTPPRYHRPAPTRATLQATLRRIRRAVLVHSVPPLESESPPDLVAIVQDLESHVLDEVPHRQFPAQQMAVSTIRFVTSSRSSPIYETCAAACHCCSEAATARTGALWAVDGRL